MAPTPFILPREKRESAILVGNGTAGPYAASLYKVFDTADVAVFAKALGEDVFTDVTASCTIAKVNPAAAYDYITVTFGAAVPATTSWYHQARRTAERSVAVTKAGTINSGELEKELSKQASAQSELRRDVDRAVRVMPGQDAITVIPGAAGDLLMFDAAGDIVSSGENVSSILGSTASAVAAATAAAISAGNAAVSAVSAAASAAAAAASAASINLPAISAAVAGSLLFVNPAGTGYDLRKGDEAQAMFSPGIQSNGTVPAVGGWFTDGAAPLPKIHRIQDRVFIGDATKYNGRQNTPYGGSSLNTRGASWVEKHGRVSIYDNTGHIALLCATVIPVGTAPGDSMGMAGSFWIVNEGNGTGGRAVYIEAMAKGLSGGTSGVELQCGNYTGVDPAVINSYSAAGQVVSAFYIGAESGINYQVGDGNDPITPATKPCGAVFDISGGSLNAAYQRFKAGIVFRDGSLYRDIDGLTGNAVAIGMAKGHAITWAAASNRAKQAKIRSDVSSAANVDVSLLFLDNAIQLTGTGELPIAQFQHNANAVNWLTFQNAIAGGAVAIGSTGNDANIVMNYLAKGTGGEHRLQVNNAIGLRVLGVAAAANYLQVQSAAAAGRPTLSFQGTDANGSLGIMGKGTGGVALIAGGAAVMFEVNATGIGFFATAPVAAKTGWAVPTGTLARTTYAAYAGKVQTAAYVQADVQAIDDACRNVSQRLAALITDLHQTAGYGLLRT